MTLAAKQTLPAHLVMKSVMKDGQIAPILSVSQTSVAGERD
jgi:hypothetical protein